MNERSARAATSSHLPFTPFRKDSAIHALSRSRHPSSALCLQHVWQQDVFTACAILLDVKNGSGLLPYLATRCRDVKDIGLVSLELKRARVRADVNCHPHEGARTSRRRSTVRKEERLVARECQVHVRRANVARKRKAGHVDLFHSGRTAQRIGKVSAVGGKGTEGRWRRIASRETERRKQ